MKTCIKCGSHAFNLYAEEIDQGGLCDVHYWQGRAHRAEALAQPEQPSFNEWTNAKLASHYFDFLKVVERYEKHGVTCQTFRHFVTEPCAECNCVAPITAIKEALAQPEQEPGLICHKHDEPKRGCAWCDKHPPKRPWVWLTDAEKAELWGRDAVIPFSYADAIEARLKEKNT